MSSNLLLILYDIISSPVILFFFISISLISSPVSLLIILISPVIGSFFFSILSYFSPVSLSINISFPVFGSLIDITFIFLFFSSSSFWIDIISFPVIGSFLISISLISSPVSLLIILISSVSSSITFSILDNFSPVSLLTKISFPVLGSLIVIISWLLILSSSIVNISFLFSESIWLT